MEKLITNYNNDVNISHGDQNIILAKVDVDKFEELSSKYKVKAVPTGKKKQRTKTFNNSFIFSISY